MNYGLYISAAGLKAQQVKQDVIANNLANAQTNGFKRDLAVVQARANAVHEDPSMRQYRLPVLENQGGGVRIQGAGVDLSQGLLENSASSTDVALQGKGFFTVGGPGASENGGKLLTRNGSFLIDSEGALVTANEGRPVLDDSGQPITLNHNLGISIGHDGTISQEGSAGIKLGIVDVTDPRRLVKLGGNLLTTKDPAAVVAADPDTKVYQYRLENSSVDPMAEMVAMMEGQRAFDANAKMITYQDQTMSLLSTIGRVA